MEFERIYAYHESGCSLEICHWWGEPCFSGAEVSLDVCLPQIPKRDRRVIMDLITALWRVNLLLLLNRSLLNKEHNLIYVP
jgi:hypothetical protein